MLRQWNFLAWSVSNIALRSYDVDPNDHILFLLRLASSYSELSVIQTLDFLRDGILFALDPNPTVDLLQQYLETEVNRPCTFFLPIKVHHPMRLVLPSIHYFHWQRAGIITT
jgi:hypothetical protein